ncbi:MAG: hypothetical protein U1E65_14850 [Myxococcota bacterium]
MKVPDFSVDLGSRFVSPPRVRLGFLATMLGFAASAGCTDPAPTARAFCQEDADCAGGTTCVADLTQGTSYCAQPCVRDSDCPVDQRCRTGIPAKLGTPEVSVCIDKLRSCAASELCNGLDDDCDGVVDGPSCTPVTACLDDAVCGAFVCAPVQNQPDALCVPPAAATVPDFGNCTEDTQCRNGVCDVGRCSPLCRPPLGGVPTCPQGDACVRGVGNGTRPGYNVCQSLCTRPADCTAPGTACVWRDVFGGSEDHGFVCAVPPTGRKGLGQDCQRVGNLGDETCGSGLCYDSFCTRPCPAANADCSDVAPDAKCCLQQLRYGIKEYSAYVCVRGGSTCG